jgi:uncharacterized protein involved in exopolysaccharide biosynthesis
MNGSIREINSETLFQLMMRRWDLIALLPLLTVLAAGIAYRVIPSQYESTARLLIQDQQTVNPFMKEMVEEWSVMQRMPLVESVFQSHDTSEQVLRRLGRLDPAASAKEINDAVMEFQQSFEAIPLGGELVLMKVRGKTPDEAYDSARALIETFTERIMRPQRETVRASSLFFENQLNQLRGEDPKIEQKLEGLADAEEGRIQRESSIRKALAKAEARLAAVKYEVERSEEALSKPSPGESELRKQLASARRRLYVLERRYGDRHPELASAKSRVRELQRAVKREQEGAYDVLADSSEASGAAGPQNNEASEAARHQALLLELREANAEVELLRNRLLTETLSTFGEGKVWQVEAPVMPTQPLGPPLLLVVLAALFAGLLLALLAVAFFAAFDDSLRSDKELAEAIDAPSFGRMPRGEI